MKAVLVRVVCVACVLSVTVSLAGCGAIAEKATETAIEKSTGVKVDKKGEEVTIKGEDGTEITSSNSGDLPEGFPEDVPVYEGKINATMKAEEVFTVGIQTSDDVQTVLDWYIEKADSDGWKKTTEMKVEDGGLVTAEKDDRMLQVTIGTSNDQGAKTQITLITGKN